MSLRILRVTVAALLGCSGALMCAASWQRWAGACSWGQTEGGTCDIVQDHRYDFLAPNSPWVPVGDAAQLAGCALLVLALAFSLLPWALTRHRPDVFSAAALMAAVLAMGAVGAATLRSGLAGQVVHPFPHDLALIVWFLVPPGLLIRWAVAARGWTRAAAGWLFVACPLVAAFSYAVGPYDARPWWEGISGLFTAVAGLSLLVAAISDRPWRARPSEDPPVVSSRSAFLRS